ncbi:MAG: DciA family protein [Gallionella sp.]
MLMVKAQILSDLQSHFIAVAQPHLALSAQVQVLGLHLGTLSIAAVNATIAAKLRQLAPEMVAKLQNRGCEVSGIRVKVQVSFDRGHRTLVPRKLSKTAQNALKDLSLNLDTSPLKSALERMAQKKG